MPQTRIAVSGSKGSGKTTVFESVVDSLNNNHVKFYGFKTFFVASGVLWLEWIHLECEKIQIGKRTGIRSMKPFLENLDRIGKILLQQNMKSRMFVADEIGFLEQLSKTMQKGIIKSITDAPSSFFTMKKDAYPFLEQVREIEGLRIYDLDGRDWQQKEDMIQKLSEGFYKKISSEPLTNRIP